MTASVKRPAELRRLTLAKLRIYRTHGGDIDAWAGHGHDDSMADDDWHLIERVRQDLYLVAAGEASPGLCAATGRRLRAATDSDETAQALRELARSRPV